MLSPAWTSFLWVSDNGNVKTRWRRLMLHPNQISLPTKKARVGGAGVGGLGTPTISLSGFCEPPYAGSGFICRVNRQAG